jgi:serine/threonine protein phosphatase PrpC
MWKSAGNCVQGRSHIKTNIPCQDKVANYSDLQMDIISLADGAGSCKLSHVGADAITKHICAVLKDNFDRFLNSESDDVANQITKSLDDVLSVEASNNSCSIKDLSSTLLFVAVKNEHYIAGSLGDGIIGILTNNSNLEVLSHPDNGEYLNETFFTTSSNASKHFRIYRGELADIMGFVIMSDGSGESLYNRKDKFLSTVCTQILEWLDDNLSQEVTDALYENLENIIRNKTMDDCSLNLLKKVTRPAHQIKEMPLQLQRELLKIDKNDVFLKNQITVLNAIERGSDTAKKIIDTTDISRNTVYRHIHDLEYKSIISKNSSKFYIKE